MKLLFFFFILIFPSSIVFGQLTKVDYYNTIDNRIYEYNKTKPSFDSIVAFVNKNFRSNEDKVRAYYSWIATNIVYDVEQLNVILHLSKMKKGITASISQNPDTVFKKRKAVCEGFSLLLNKFCAASSIPSFMVVGYTKLPDGDVYTEIYHAWSVVKTDSTWHLIDATWSGGFVNAMNQYIKRFSDKYFFSKPDDFLMDHLPLDPMWQLKNYPISKNIFFGIKDTLPPNFLNYTDSINSYSKTNSVKQKQIDLIHYHLFDPAQPEYKLELDRITNNIAADYLLEASIHYESFLSFQNTKMGKHPSLANCKKAKSMLEITKQDLIKAIDFLKNQKAYTNEFDVIFKEMMNNASKNLASIKETSNALSSYMKNIGRK